MHNPYQSESAKIIDIKWQADGIKLFRFEFAQKIWGYKFEVKPGQIIELSIPGFGEAPFAPCNAPDSKYLELCVRNTGGRLTNKLHSLKKGDAVGVRGPFGNGWIDDLQKKNLLIVVGGLGLIPLRTLLLGKDKFFGKDSKIQIFYGAKKPEDMLFRHEYNKWKKQNIDIQLTIDKECPNWNGCIGLVTTLFDKNEIVENARAFLCGPPIMYKFVLQKLKEKGMPDEDIFVSLERRMHCGIGVCQHCAIGPYYVCKNGPVFRYDKIKNIEGAI